MGLKQISIAVPVPIPLPMQAWERNASFSPLEGCPQDATRKAPDTVNLGGVFRRRILVGNPDVDQATMRLIFNHDIKLRRSAGKSASWYT